MKELIYEIVFDLLCTCEFIKGKQLDDILSNMDFICNNDINLFSNISLLKRRNNIDNIIKSNNITICPI